MDEYKILLGYLTIAIAFVSYGLYFRDIFSGKTKPQPFSWFIWSVLSAIAFSAQVTENAGPGAWITGLTAAVCLVISVLASFKMTWRFSLLDWGSLIAAMAALIVWNYTKQPNLAVILVTITYALGFLPTFYKGYLRPNEETLETFALNASKFGIAVFALSSFSVATWLYPAALFFLNSVLAGMLFIRRRYIS